MSLLIKLNKEVETKVDVLKTFLHMYCYVNNIKLSDNELKAMAYYVIYGLNDSTTELILKSKILKESSLHNTFSRFRKAEFIRRVNKRDVLNEKFKLSLEDNIIVALIKIHV